MGCLICDPKGVATCRLKTAILGYLTLDTNLNHAYFQCAFLGNFISF